MQITKENKELEVSQALRIVVRSCLGRYAKAWDELMLRQPLVSPFLRSWWLDAVGDETARIILVLDGDRLVGGVPLEVRSLYGVALFRFLGEAFLPDHLDLIAEPSKEREVIASLKSWFSLRGDRLFDLQGAAQDARIAQALPEPVRRDVLDEAGYLYIPSSIDVILKSWRARHRHELKRALQHIGEKNVRFETFEKSEAESAVATMRDLHLAQFSGSGLRPVWNRFENAIRAGMERDEWVAQKIVDSNGQPVAISIGFLVGNRLSAYQLGRNTDPAWRDLGKVLTYRKVESACERGVQELDFLRGVTRNKSHWVENRREIIRLRAAHGRRARIAYEAERFIRRGTQALGLRKSGIGKDSHDVDV